MMEFWHWAKDKSWGNSYTASALTALRFGRPLYMVQDVLKRYVEKEDDDGDDGW